MMNENPRYRTLVSIIIGSTLTCFLGSGAVWSYLNNKHQDAILSLEKQVHTLEMEKADSQRKHNEGILLIENTKASLEIRKSKEKYFAIIIDLSKQYQKIRDQYSDSPSPRLNNDKSYTKRLDRIRFFCYKGRRDLFFSGIEF